jgi:hypothetical protein
MRRSDRAEVGRFVWMAASMVTVFFGSWWISGNWRVSAVITIVICTPLLALALAVRR